jgi:hypothetical protein
VSPENLSPPIWMLPVLPSEISGADFFAGAAKSVSTPQSNTADKSDFFIFFPFILK